ncbi:MAG TPA: HD domain-containing protein [Ktedonobacteraceae bacterium]|nr:HD domain-containing protein [Ktedonobacteraceae bacterium]
MNIDERLVKQAEQKASLLLEPLGDRWLHTLGVVRQACVVGQAFEEEDRLYLIAAAYLHDIGYAPSLQKTGFHPIDGAAYVRETFGDERLASLIAYHSEAQVEARLRGYASALDQFPREHSAVADALTYCDMTTSPTGKSITFEERINDILSRYDETSIVNQSIRQARPSLLADVEHTQQKLQEHHLIHHA